jgi:hypothetical protein
MEWMICAVIILILTHLMYRNSNKEQSGKQTNILDLKTNNSGSITGVQEKDTTTD